MKCGSYIKYGRRTKRSKQDTIIDSRSWWQTGDTGLFPENETVGQLLDHGYITCDGEIKVTFSTWVECCSANVEINYLCNKCGQRFFPHLPGGVTGDLSGAVDAMLTNAVAAMDAVPLIAEATRVELERRQKLQQMVADLKQRQAEQAAQKQKKRQRV